LEDITALTFLFLGAMAAAFIEKVKPEVWYCGNFEKGRGFFMVVDLKEAADVATIVDPLIVLFNAKVVRPVAVVFRLTLYEGRTSLLWT
jgi:hypothetical protein